MRNAFIIMALIIFCGCEKNENDGKINYSGCNCIDNNENFQPVVISNNDYYQFTFNRDSKIHIYIYNNSISAGIESGSNLVFQYKYLFDDDSVIIDDEYSEIIKFEIESGIDNFIISGDDLKKSNAVVGVFSLLPDGGYHWITSGCIKGVKINENEWQIDMNIIAKREYGDFSKMISERFTVDEK